MPIQKDASGRRCVVVEVEVPGTPEQVWKAIATGPGISSWFVPSEVDEREGGLATANFGPGMEAAATITQWDPPRRFVADSKDLGPDAPAVASEWIVEARSGGTCVVRVVHSLFADGDDWDDQLGGLEHGWPSFFRILRLYLEHFPGQTSSSFQLMGMAPPPRDDAWAAFTSALGLAGAGLGKVVRSPVGAPALAGTVEGVGAEGYPELLLRLHEPAPGTAHLFPMEMSGQVYLSARMYLYGDTADVAAAREEPLWQAWISERFPAGGATP
jgi:uncharacterized protein YndB with AHSA1/START domain